MTQKILLIFLFAVVCFYKSVTAQLKIQYCPKDWTFYEDSCYIFQSQKLTWQEAENNCKRINGNLASIHNNGERAKIESLFDSRFQTEYVWIGGSDTGEEGKWIWTDRSSMNYIVWESGQPNSGTAENCLGVYWSKKTWYDRPCNSAYSSVCKKIAKPDIFGSGKMARLYSCSFETDLCGFQNSSPTGYRWLRHSGSTGSTSTGPDGASHGSYYMYTEASNGNTGYKAQLLSPVWNNTCLSEVSFNYSMYGSRIGQLKVSVIDIVTNQVVDELLRSGNAGPGWSWKSLYVPSTASQFRVIFEATRGSDYQGDIAIDNVFVKQMTNCTEHCSPPLPVTSGIMTWDKPAYRNKVTYNCSEGLSFLGQDKKVVTYYCLPDGSWNYAFNRAYCEASCPTELDVSGKSGLILSPGSPGMYKNSQTCSWNIQGIPGHTISLEFKYFDSEYLYDKLDIRQYKSSTVLASLSDRVPPVIPLQMDRFSLTWTSDKSGTERGFYLRWSVSPCSKAINPTNGQVTYTGLFIGDTATFSCAYGYDLVGASNATCMKDGWSHNTPACNIRHCPKLITPDNGRLSSNTFTYGSRITHQCNTGYRLTGDQIRTCQANSTWTGVDVNCTVQDCGPLETPSFGKKFGKETIYQSRVEFTCQYGIESGSTLRTCQSDGRWSGTDVRCMDPVQCDFERGFCGLIQDKTDDYDWSRGRGSTPSSGTGPSSSNGYFAFTEGSSNGLTTGMKARLNSREFLPVLSCSTLMFAYNMNGAGMGDLRVYMNERVLFSKEKKSLIFEKRGDQGAEWKNATLTIRTDPYAYTWFTFEAVHGVDYHSDVSIDDIVFIEGCPSLTTTTTSPPTTTKLTTTTKTTLTTSSASPTTPLPTHAGVSQVLPPMRWHQNHELTPSSAQSMVRFSSPNYDSGYVSCNNCTWTFRDTSGFGKLKIVFVEFDLPPRDQNGYTNYVILKSFSSTGIVYETTLWGTDGKTRTDLVSSDASRLDITFHSEMVPGTSYKGFRGYVIDDQGNY